MKKSIKIDKNHEKIEKNRKNTVGKNLGTPKMMKNDPKKAAREAPKIEKSASKTPPNLGGF